MAAFPGLRSSSGGKSRYFNASRGSPAGWSTRLIVGTFSSAGDLPGVPPTAWMNCAAANDGKSTNHRHNQR